MAFLKEFFEKVDFEKKSADDKKSMQNYPEGKAYAISTIISCAGRFNLFVKLLNRLGLPYCKNQYCYWSNQKTGSLPEEGPLVQLRYANNLAALLCDCQLSAANRS